MEQKSFISGTLYRKDDTWFLNIGDRSVAVRVPISIDPALDGQKVSLIGETCVDGTFLAEGIASHAAIADRAFEIYKSGRGGSAVDQWCLAENELLGLAGEGVFTVMGTVTGPGHGGLTVKAFVRNVGTEDKLLGQTMTDAEGHYCIPYAPDQTGGQSAVDLVIGLYQNEDPLQSSDVVFNAQRREIRDFVLPPTNEPELRCLSDKIKPLLGNRISVGGLNENQIHFLKQKTGIDGDKIGWLARSRNLAGDDDTLASFYYALLSQGLPTDPAELLAYPRTAITGAVGRAGGLNLIPVLKTGDVNHILDELLPKFRADNLLKLARPGESASLGDILRTMPAALPQGLAEKVAEVIGRTGFDPLSIQEEFKTAGLSPEQSVSVERALRLGDLTRGNLPLMKHLQDLSVNDGDASLKSLASIGRDQWVDKAYLYGVPAGAGLTPESYAQELEDSVEKAHPTATLAARIYAGDLVIARAGFEKIGAFLNNNPGVDILNANIPAFIETANLSGVDDKDQMIRSLMILQRVKRLSVTWNEAGALLNSGLDSALAVVALGEDRLKERLGEEVAPDRAAALYQNARKTRDVGLALMARLIPRFSPTPVAAMGTATRLDAETIRTKLKDYPNVQELFGSLDYCECDPSRSVLSPSAYFVDLLQFLENTEALEAFLGRRPDLADLELSAGNTKTELPIIDLVLEILENAVAAFPLTVSLPAGASGEDELNRKPLSSNITDVLQMTSLETIGSDLNAEKARAQFAFDRADAWTVSDGQRRWTLENQAGRIFIKDPKHPYWGQQISAHGMDLKAIGGQMDEGRLPPPIKAGIEEMQRRQSMKRYLRISDYSISPIHTGKEWKVNYRLAVKATAVVGENQGQLTLQTPEGDNLLTRKYSPQAVKAVAKGLQKGVITGILGTLVPDSPGSEVKIHGPDVSIEFPGQVIVRIEPDSLVLNSLSYQTVGESEDLKACPANQNPIAYTTIRKTNFPWSLPFNLPLESVRACLERAGLTRRQLIELNKPETYLTNSVWMNEVLGISREEADLIAKRLQGADLWQAWGLTPDATGKVRVFDTSAGKNVPEDSSPPGNPGEVLSRVSILMRQSRLSYDDLLRVLNTAFVGASSLKITPVERSDEACDACNLFVAGLNAGHFSQIHTFVRLWRKLGWEIADLDRALYPLKGWEFACPYLINLSHIKRMQEILNLPAAVLSTWWSGVQALLYTPYSLPDEPDSKSLYEEVFLNPAVQTPADPDFALRDDRSGVRNSGKTLSAKAAVLSAALGIRQETFNQLLSNMLSQGLLKDELTLSTLFELYRTSGLIQALGISSTDFFSVRSLVKGSPFDSTQRMIEFCETVGFIQNSGLTVEEVAYLLQNVTAPGFALALGDEQAAQMLTAVRSAIQNQLNTMDQKVRDLIRNNPGGPTVLRCLTGQEAVNADATALVVGYAPGDTAEGVTRDLILASSGANGSKITWASSNPAVIGNDGKVRRPDASQTDASVVLTSTVANSDGSITATRVFDVTVIKQLTDQEVVDADAAALVVGYAAGDSAEGVTRDLFLGSSGTNGSTITWASSNPAVIGNDGKVKRPDSAQGDASVILTATVANSDGSIVATRLFDLIVTKQLTGQEAVDADAAALVIGYAPGDAAEGVTRDLVLASSGVNGSKITWASSNPSVIGNDGKVKRPDSAQGDISVVLTATIANSDNSISTSKVFYSPGLLNLNPLDANRLRNIFRDPGITQQITDVILGVIADLLGLELPVARQFLVTDPTQAALLYLEDAADGSRKDGIEVFFDPLFVGTDSNTTPESPDAYTIIHRLYKASIILTRLQVKPAQIAWFADPRFDMQALDFNALPVANGAPDALFQNWQRLVTLFQIRDGFPQMSALLEKYVGALRFRPRLPSPGRFGPILPQPHPYPVPWGGRPNRPIPPTPAKDPLQAVAVLAGALTPLPGKIQTASPDAVYKTAVNTVQNAADLLGIKDLADFRDPLKLKEWIDLLHGLKKLGVDIPQANLFTEDWIPPDPNAKTPDPATEAEISARALLRAKYGPDCWRDIVKPISDRLRGRQRDSLVDYLIHREDLRDVNELFEYYLLDTQMSPGMMTSRLVQAIAAVQLFVQQCLLNLIENVTLDEGDRKRWEWMKNYRVWEANRKVFLYPENWLFPELRDDKTQIFTSLESALAQGEPNDQLARESLLAYLDEEADLEKIKVFGMFESLEEDSGKRTLFIVGRTPDQPYHYFWRKCEEFGDPSANWNGWERIEMDISNDHTLPFIFDGNLHIAWPVMKQVVDELTKEKKWEIQLAWISRSIKGWSQRKAGKETIHHNYLVHISEDRIIALRACPSEGGVVFYVYGASEIQSPLLQLPSEKFQFSSSPGDVEITIQVYKEFTLADGTKVYEPGHSPSVSFTIYFDIFEWTEKPYNWNPGKGDYINKDQQQVVYPTKNDENPYSYTAKCDHSSFDNVQNKTRWIEWRYKQVVVNVSPDSNCTRPPDTTCTAPDDQYLSQCNFVISMSCSNQPQSVDPDRKVNMAPVGKFTLTRAKDIEIGDGSGAPPFTSLHCAGSFENGYREYPEYANGTATDYQAFLTVPNALVFSSLPQGGFFTVQAGNRGIPDNISGGTWYYEDNLIKLLFQIRLKAKNDFQNCLLAFLEPPPNSFNLRGMAYEDMESLFQPAVQSKTDQGNLFQSRYVSNDLVDGSSVEIAIVFDLRLPSGIYNWEIFYHAPILVAEFLTRHLRFEDAQRWLNHIFDPTAKTQGDPKNFWQFLPFRDAGSQLQAMFTALGKLAQNQSLTDSEKSAIDKFNSQIHSWLAHPFSPFAVARTRWTSFQWRTIFAYLDNLISWGDQMFHTFTRESVNEAILYFVLAGKLLGPRPNPIRSPEEKPPLSYRTINGQWDDFWKEWYNATNHLPLEQGPPAPAKENGQTEALMSLGMSCFCIPPNETLLGYWDTIEDRLFKIRNCMDIEGIHRELPLFAPPIDPELLIRATAAGLELETVLANLMAPLWPYRFNLLLQKANEICAEVKSLGAALLAALEKKDSEDLALLRSSQEIAMLNLVRYVRDQQVKEAEANLDMLNQNMALVRERFSHYQKLLGKSAAPSDPSELPVLSTSSSLRLAANAPGEARSCGLIQYEVDQLNSLSEANDYATAAGISSTLASVLHSLPDSISGSSLYLQIKIGGSHFGNAANAVASFLNMLAGRASHEANRKGLFASYQRRQDEWVFQSKLALEEMKQINKQIIAAEIRKAIAERELENHDKQIENAKAVDEFMHSRYTSQELYSWMVSGISAAYFGSYQMAVDMAKCAEKAFQYEMGVENTSFIQYGYWDSLKKGLLSGENLSLDLKRMEMAYLEQNRREFEITKHVSLLQTDPTKLITLRETGACEVALPEAIFDMDFPGHYFRRLKSVSLTIPCIAGPYTGVSCTMTLLKNSVRVKPSLPNNRYERDGSGDDLRFRDQGVPIDSMATSHGQNDSGVFELNFRDERYLPFEGAGAISTWRISLPAEVRQFDYDTISDVVLHLKYTAREGGEPLRSAAVAALKAGFEKTAENGCVRLFSVRHDFPAEWARFAGLTLNEKIKTAGLSLSLRKEHFPFWSNGIIRDIHSVNIFAQFPKGVTGAVSIAKNAAGDEPKEMFTVPKYGEMLIGQLPSLPDFNKDAKWPIQLDVYLSSNEMEDIWMAVSWSSKRG